MKTTAIQPVPLPTAAPECRPSVAPMPWSRRVQLAERPDRDEWDLLLRAAGRMRVRVTPTPSADAGAD
ncbi:MAG: hypothetical protein U0574_09175 [Phycisphaerales bacterium]